MKHPWVGWTLLLLAALTLTSCTQSPARKGAPATVTPLHGSILPVVHAFNAATGHPRVLLIISPT